MEKIRQQFAAQLKQALVAAGFEPKPATLEREFNLRYWGKPVSLHGVRRWLCGETLPTEDKLQVLIEWLKISPEQLLYQDTQKNLQEKRDSLYGVNALDREVISAYLQLPLEKRKVVSEVIRAFAQVKISQQQD